MLATASKTLHMCRNEPTTTGRKAAVVVVTVVMISREGLGASRAAPTAGHVQAAAPTTGLASQRPDAWWCQERHNGCSGSPACRLHAARCRRLQARSRKSSRQAKASGPLYKPHLPYSLAMIGSCPDCITQQLAINDLYLPMCRPKAGPVDEAASRLRPSALLYSHKPSSCMGPPPSSSPASLWPAIGG